MAKPPPGAMSTPYGENAEEGGSLKDMLKQTTYFKDATFNTDPPKRDGESPFKKDESNPELKPARPAGSKEFDMTTKKVLVGMLMDRNIDAVNMTESDITFKYKDKLYRITAV